MNAVKSLEGHLLVAAPHMANPDFARTVVLLIQHSSEGAAGVVLNRPLSVSTKELWEQLSDKFCVVDQCVRFGGPVPGPLIALHSDASLADAQVPPGIFLAAQRGHLERLARNSRQPMRVFVGHTGWGQGQLESELARGDWLLLPATLEHVFADDDKLWTNAVRQVGQSFVRNVLGIKHVPQNPSWN